MSTIIDGSAGITFPNSTTQSGAVSQPALPFTANGVVYASSTSALATGSSLVWTGSALGIGTSSPTRSLEVSTSSYFQLRLGYSVSSSTYTYDIGRSGSDGFLYFYGNQTGYTGYIFSGVDGEKMRLDSGGNLLVGLASTQLGAVNGTIQLNCPSSNNSALFKSTASSSGVYGPWIYFSAQSPNNTAQYFLYCSDNSALRFNFYSNGGIANYSANNVNLSDRREKTNFAPSKSYLDVICAIPVQTFNYIDQNLEEDGGLTLGVVAQDVQKVAPELVHESNWANKDEPEKMRLSIYQTDLQYALMKSIQELSTLITAQQSTIQSLTDRITALENKA